MEAAASAPFKSTHNITRASVGARSCSRFDLSLELKVNGAPTCQWSVVTPTNVNSWICQTELDMR